MGSNRMGGVVKQMISDFFSTQPSQAPLVSGFAQVFLLGSLLLLLKCTLRWKDKALYRRLFKGLQVLQLLALYGWYWAAGFPLDHSLPLYHCRLAMFALLLLPQPSKGKDYFSFLGLGGVICAFVYPVFDPFPLFHVTIFSYILGHWALWGNGLIYLLSTDCRQTLTIKEIIGYTLVLNVCLVLVNQLTGGNYGFLAVTPLVNSTNLLLNYVLVSFATIALVVMVQMVYQRKKDGRNGK